MGVGSLKGTIHFPVKILFAACGSIGHIAPCVAVWRTVQKRDSAAQAHFACSDRAGDLDFLRAEDIEPTVIGGRNVRLMTLPVEFVCAWRMLGQQRPDVIFTKGGGVTVAVALAGWIRGIPIIVHESDAVPGRATRLIGKIARETISGFPNNPVRSVVLKGLKERGLQHTGLSGQRPILLIMGGSQGAVALNDAVCDHLAQLLDIVDVIHITGTGKSGATPVPGRYWTCEFAQNEFSDLLACADIVLCRAGAGTIGELVARGVAAILVPLRGLAHDHQERNARWLEERGACDIVEQENLSSELLPVIVRLTQDAGARRAKAEVIRSLYKPNSSENVTNIILAYSVKHGGVS